MVNRMLNIKPENAAKRAIMAMAKVRSLWTLAVWAPCLCTPALSVLGQMCPCDTVKPMPIQHGC